MEKSERNSHLCSKGECPALSPHAIGPSGRTRVLSGSSAQISREIWSLSFEVWPRSHQTGTLLHGLGEPEPTALIRFEV